MQTFIAIMHGSIDEQLGGSAFLVGELLVTDAIRLIPYKIIDHEYIFGEYVYLTSTIPSENAYCS